MGKPITYVTFGPNDRHEISGKVFDRYCVAVVHGDAFEVFTLFGLDYGYDYTEEEFKDKDIDDWVARYFPRGLIEVPE